MVSMLCSRINIRIIIINLNHQSSLQIFEFQLTYFNPSPATKMYGRLHERKLKQDDYLMSCEKARSQLSSYIDEEAKRVNIDSAKKRAVLQHMDYDGFRQMVLGANIFPTKTTELQKFTKGENTQIVHNKIYLQNATNPMQKTQKPIPIEVIAQVHGKSELLCNSFREFKKKFTENYPKNGEFSSSDAEILYTLVKHQDQQRIAKIFNMQCEANILVKVIDLFEFIVRYLRQNNNESKVIQEILFQVKFLQTVLKLKTMREFSLSILSKKERTRIIEFLSNAKAIMTMHTNKVEGQKQQTIIPQNGPKHNDQTSNKESQQNKSQISTQGVINEDEKSIDELISILSKKL